MIKDSISAGEANKTKNRYKNIFPCEILITNVLS